MKTAPYLWLAATVVLMAPQHAYSQKSDKLPQQCARMQQMHQAMETTTTAQNAKLHKLTEAMDNAAEGQRVAAMSAVIHELVAQRAMQHSMADHMQSAMMGHMREHMQQGGKAGLQKCPMMDGQSMMGKGMMGKGMMHP